jgi:hypothetical protein
MYPSAKIRKQCGEPKNTKYGALQGNPSFLPQTDSILTRGLRNRSHSAQKKKVGIRIEYRPSLILIIRANYARLLISRFTLGTFSNRVDSIAVRDIEGLIRKHRRGIDRTPHVNFC